jgi:hypothetical protein
VGHPYDRILKTDAPLTNARAYYRDSGKFVGTSWFNVIDDKWINVDDDITGFPTRVEYPIPGLTIYQDGLLCKMCPQIYPFIVNNVKHLLCNNLTDTMCAFAID